MAKGIGNKGISLVEMVVILAILSVVTVASLIGLKLITEKPVDACGECIANSIEELRTITMGKESCEGEISVDSEGVVWFKETVDSTAKPAKKVGASGLTLTATFQNGATCVIDSSNPLTIEFKRETGGLKEDPGAGRDYLKEISISKGSKEVKVTIGRIAGKVALTR